MVDIPPIPQGDSAKLDWIANQTLFFMRESERRLNYLTEQQEKQGESFTTLKKDMAALKTTQAVMAQHLDDHLRTCEDRHHRVDQQFTIFVNDLGDHHDAIAELKQAVAEKADRKDVHKIELWNAKLIGIVVGAGGFGGLVATGVNIAMRIGQQPP